MEDALLTHVCTDLLTEISRAAQAHRAGKATLDDEAEHVAAQTCAPSTAESSTVDFGAAPSAPSKPPPEAVAKVLNQLREQIILELGLAMHQRAQLAVSRVGEQTSSAGKDVATQMLAEVCVRAAKNAHAYEEHTGPATNSKCADAANFVEEIIQYVGAATTGWVNSKNGRKEICRMLGQLHALLTAG